MSNPYNSLISAFRNVASNSTDENFYVGVVSSELPNLKIKVAGIEIDKDNIMINKWLVDREKEITTDTVLGQITNHAHKSKTYQDKLKVGDEIAMLRLGDIFYILCKVVSLSG